MAKEGRNHAVARATARREAIVAIRYLGERAKNGFQVSDLCAPGGPASTVTAARAYMARAVEYGHVERQGRIPGWKYISELLAAAAVQVHEQVKIATQQNSMPPHQPSEPKKVQSVIPLSAHVPELHLLYHYLDLEAGSTLDPSMIESCLGSKVPGLPAFPYCSVGQARAHLNSVATARHSLVECSTTEDRWVLRAVPDQWVQERFTRREKERPKVSLPAVSLQLKQETSARIPPEPMAIRCDPTIVLQVYTEYFGLVVLMQLGGDLFGNLNDDQRWMRGMLIYLYFEYTSLSVQEVGQYVGLKAAASIYRWRNEIHSYRHHPDVRAQLDELKQLIASKLENQKAA